jgi:hypothetical protein
MGQKHEPGEEAAAPSSESESMGEAGEKKPGEKEVAAANRNGCALPFPSLPVPSRLHPSIFMPIPKFSNSPFTGSLVYPLTVGSFPLGISFPLLSPLLFLPLHLPPSRFFLIFSCFFSHSFKGFSSFPISFASPVFPGFPRFLLLLPFKPMMPSGEKQPAKR